MTTFLLKAFISGLIVAGISTLSKSNQTLAVLLASFPLASALAFPLIYWETNDALLIQEMSVKVFLVTLPSLFFFILLRYTTKYINFYLALLLSSILVLIICYIYIKIMTSVFSIEFTL